MSVTSEVIHRIAHLARLDVNQAQTPVLEYVSNLNNLLGLIDQMTDINTDTIAPMSHPLENQQQRLREDLITESNNRERFQAIAPEILEGLYIVPKVIE